MQWLRRNYRKPWFWGPLGLAIAVFVTQLTYPDDKSVQGSYYRVMSAVNRAEPHALFPYVETEAQHAAFTIGKYTREARDLVRASYPEPQKSRELERLEPLAAVEPGPGVFTWYAEQHGWIARLRLDLSGIEHIEIEGDRATVETVRGTRYPFRRRDTGMWGLTLYTARLAADAEKAARDFAQIEAAARDYQASGPQRER